MKQFYILLFAALYSMVASAQSSPSKLAITDVSVVDVRNGKLLPAMTVVVEEGKITQVAAAKKVKIPSGHLVIDGTGKFLMPGMTDGHIHFFQSGGLYTRPDAINLTNLVTYREELRRGAEALPDFLRRYLRLGITTLADVGGPMRNFSIRDSVVKNNLSPHVLVTGPLFSMIRNKELEIDNDIPIVKITSTVQADSLLGILLPLKPDYLKIWYIVTPEIPAEKTFPVVKYIAEQTHKAGLKLAVHATQLNTATHAVEAGADILVHSIDNAVIPQSLIAKMAQQNVSYIPTLNVMGNYFKTFSGKLDFNVQDLFYANPFFYGSLTDLESISEAHLPPHVKMLRKNGIPPAVGRSDSLMAINLKALANGNVNIVTGTDAGNIGTQHASSFLQELMAMQRAGLTNKQIIQAATINAANAFAQQSGVVEKGRKADLVLLEKDPLSSLENLNSITHVITDGQALMADTLIVESPEMVVQRQLNAYNARNLEAFLDTYADDVTLYNFPDSLMSTGKEPMREMYGGMFSQLRYLHCTIEKRIVLGNRVIDHERVRFNDQTIHAVAIYEVINGKIRKVTFLE